MSSRRQSSASSDIFIASSLIADSPEKDKENAEPGDTPIARRTGESGSRSARKSMLSRRRSSGAGRRLSGFGGGGWFDANNADKDKMDSMYSRVIKMNTENKITRDKCWGLHFIDFMDKMLLDEEQGKGSAPKVNFQKASCTIDASVKIYSHRVDATHQSSYSLLENLSRTENDKAGDRSGDGAVGGSERSARIGVQETLKKAEQLNLSNLDRAFAVDPMFHKMSRIFDEAGSKGMLLNNLCVRDGCQVSFDSDVTADATEPPSEEESGDEDDVSGQENANDQGSENEPKSSEQAHSKKEGNENGIQAKKTASASGGMVDVSVLRTKLFGLCEDLSLEEFREQIAELDQDQNGGTTAVNAGSSCSNGGDAESDSDSDGGGGGFDDIPCGDDAAFDGGSAPMDEGASAPLAEDADPFREDTGASWGPPGVSNTAENGIHKGPLPFCAEGDNGWFGAAGMGGQEGGDSAAGKDGRYSPQHSGPASLQDRLCDDLKVVNDDYAFYDEGALAAAAASNHWAGAAHWKFVGRKKKVARPKRKGSEGDDGLEAEGDDENGGRKTRGKRRLPAIDFDAPAVDDGAFAPPKPPARARGGRKSDPTLLSEDYVKRALKAAEDGSNTYTLPENAGFKPKDLGELFIRRGAFAKRWAVVEAGGISGDGSRHDDLQGFHDSSGRSGAGDDGDLLFGGDDGGYGGGDDFDDDDDDDVGSEGFHFAPEFAVRGSGGGGLERGADGVIIDDFQAKGLVSADRKVEKITVTYARKAKRVDVRRLKGDLWRKIDAAVVKKERTSLSGSTVVMEEDDNPETENKEPDGDEEGVSNSSKATPPSTPPDIVDMTFSDIVHDVASQEEQSGVTVPFYFICILHLANERGLRLEGHEDLLDFSVASDPVTAGSY